MYEYFNDFLKSNIKLLESTLVVNWTPLFWNPIPCVESPLEYSGCQVMISMVGCEKNTLIAMEHGAGSKVKRPITTFFL